jgi:hypothetical protein
MARLELVHCELEPGDVLAFHSNTLHRSDANRSDKPRWCMICCYNARSNDPYKPSHHPQYTPLEVVPRSAIVEVGRRGLAGDGVQSGAWLDPNTDRSATSLVT